MHITSVKLRNVRGIVSLGVDNLPASGIVVIHGPNEAGKSTLLEAIKIALTESHTSAARRPKAGFASHGAAWLAPVNSDEAPEVTVGLCIRDYELTIYKSFLKKKAAVLTVSAPRPENHTGAQAEARLAEILSQNVELELLNSLFLNQGEEGEAVAAVGLQSLQVALQEAAGMPDGAAAAEDTVLGQRVSKECDRYFTGAKKQPTGEYAVAIKRQQQAQQALAQAEKEMAALEQLVVGVTQAQATLADAQAAIPAGEAEVKERENTATLARQAREQREQAQQELERARYDVQRVRADLEQRASLRAELDGAVTAVHTYTDQVTQAQEAADSEATAYDEAQQGLQAAQAERESTAAAIQVARRTLRNASERAGYQALRDRMEGIEELHRTLITATNRAAARGTVVGDQEVRMVEAATNELELARRLEESAAAKLVFSADSTSEITVDGVAVTVEAAAEAAVTLRDGTVITIGDLHARFVAGGIIGAAGTDSAAEVDAKRRHLAELLETLDCVDLAAVRERRDEHRAEAEAVSRAKADLDAALAGDDLAELRARLAASTPDEEAEILSVAEAQQALDAAEEAGEAANEHYLVAHTRMEALHGKPAALRLALAQQQLENAQEQAERVRAKLTAAEDAAATAELEAAVAELSLTVAAHERTCAELSTRVEELDPDTAQKLLEGAKSQLAHLKQRKNEAEREILFKQGYIEQAEGKAEALLAAQAELAAADTQLASVARRAQAALHLAELMARHRAASRQRYAAPFADKLTQLAKVIYGPSVRFELSDELQVDKRTRAGATVGLADLSGGAQEQLALLVRFAIASLVARPDSADAPVPAVPIIIDDALGSTDSHRLELMSTLFSDIGKTAQVIVLTCMPQRFDRIPGRVSLDIEQLKEK